MPYFQGKLVNAKGRAVAEPVEGDYQQRREPDGGVVWFGKCTLPLGVVVPLGPYQLVLQNGRTAQVRVVDGTYKMDSAGVLQFEGVGPLP